MGNSKMRPIDADNIGTKRATFIKYQIQKLEKTFQMISKIIKNENQKFVQKLTPIITERKSKIKINTNDGKFKNASN